MATRRIRKEHNEAAELREINIVCVTMDLSLDAENWDS
jgi:hypothetical protein